MITSRGVNGYLIRSYDGCQWLHPAQSTLFDFCAGNRHQIVAGARVKAVKVTPMLLVARVEVAKVAQLIGLSCKCGTNYTL